MVAHLVAVLGRDNQWCLRVEEDANGAHADAVKSATVRTSPVFAVNPTAASKKALSEADHLAFFTLDSPFLAIGEASPALQNKLWFNHGIASVVLATQEPKEIVEMQRLWAKQLRTTEVWQLHEKRRIEARIEYAPAAPIRAEHWQLRPFQNLRDPDLLVLLREIQLNLHILAVQTAQHLPEYQTTVARIVAAVSEIVDELLWLQDTSSEPPKSLNKKMAEALSKGSPDRVHKRVNLRVDTLVQVNSSLTYVLSQAFFGASPILTNRPLVGSFSLLGIGTAWRAVVRLTAHIEQCFAQQPVVGAVKQYYSRLPGVDVRFNEDHGVSSSQWDPKRFTVDAHFDNVVTAQGKPKLVHFSARLGFGETEFTATSATQVLTAADSVRWSLMTLTHELLHAHVHALLAVVFRVPDFPPIEDAMNSHMRAYRPHAHKHGAELKGETLGQSVVYAAFEYATISRASIEWQRQAKREDSPSGRANLHALEDADFILDYRAREPFMEEIMVHVLDLHYFYQGNVALYLDLLWESWATVPAVIESVEEYILRSLAAVASSLPGSVNDRFDASVRALKACMERLASRKRGNSLVPTVVDTIERKASRKVLRAGFSVQLYIADITRRLLYSERLQHALIDSDANVTVSEGAVNYRATVGEFGASPVANPLAFILDRLRRSASGEDTQMLTEEYRSAWLFLAAASPQPNKGN